MSSLLYTEHYIDPTNISGFNPAGLNRHFFGQLRPALGRVYITATFYSMKGDMSSGDLAEWHDFKSFWNDQNETYLVNGLPMHPDTLYAVMPKDLTDLEAPNWFNMILATYVGYDYYGISSGTG